MQLGRTVVDLQLTIQMYVTKGSRQPFIFVYNKRAFFDAFGFEIHSRLHHMTFVIPVRFTCISFYFLFAIAFICKSLYIFVVS